MTTEQQVKYYRQEIHHWHNELTKMRTERDDLKAKLKPFVCFQCGTDGPELICPNCAEDRFKAKLDRTNQHAVYSATENNELRDKLAQVEKGRSEDKTYIEDLCKDLCKMEDALGFAQDQRDKDGVFIPTIGPWLERLRDLIAAEGELGDVKERLSQVEADAAAMREALNCAYADLDPDTIRPLLYRALQCGSGQRLLDELVYLRDEHTRQVGEISFLSATAQRRLELLRRAVALNSDCIACGNRVGSWLTDAQPHKPDCPLAGELSEAKPEQYTEPIHDHGAYGTAMKKEAK